MEEDQCGEEGLLGDVKLSKLLGWAFEESSDREERALRLSEQHEDGRPRVDIQRMLSYYHIIMEGTVPADRGPGSGFVCKCSLSRSSFCGEASQISELDERRQGLAGCLALPLGKACLVHPSLGVPGMD